MSLYTSNLPNDEDMNKALSTCGIPVISLPLPVCDCIFSGVSTDAAPLCVGIERKKVGDTVSSIVTGRYLFQAQNAKEAGVDVLCLIVEGRVRSNPDDGLLEVPVWGINPRTLHKAEMWQPVKPAITYSRFDQFLTELDYLTSIIVKRTENVKETACVIKAMYSNFQQPPESHNSLHMIFRTPLPGTLLVRPSLLRRIASELPGIGYERSRAVSEKFSSVREMVNAGESEWLDIEGIGKKTAQKVIEAMTRQTTQKSV